MDKSKLWLSIEEIAKRGELSDIRLRKLIQDGVLYHKKVPFIESLYEFSCFGDYFKVYDDFLSSFESSTPPRDPIYFEEDKIKAVLNNLSCNSTFNDEILGKIVHSLIGEPSKFENIIDCINFIFQNDEYFDLLAKNINFHFCSSDELKLQFAEFDDEIGRNRFKGELSFLDPEFKYNEITPIKISNYFINLNQTQKKIFLRFIMSYDCNLCFNNPFRSLPNKFTEFLKLDDKLEQEKRDVPKVLINLRNLERYKANNQDVAGAVHTSNIKDFLNKSGDLHWSLYPDFNLQRNSDIKFDSKATSFAIELKIASNIIWYPEMASIIENPDLIIQSISDILDNPESNILLFLPKSFLAQKNFNKLRGYFEKYVMTKAVIKLESELPQTKSIAILFTPKSNNEFKPFYGEVSSWKVLSVLVEKVLNNEKIPFYLKSEDKEWRPFKE